jgi:hypothetical protein
VIIFYDGANDCTYFSQNRTAYAHLGYRRLRGLIESYHHSFLGLLKPLNAAMYASFSKELYDKIRQGLINLKADDPELIKYLDSAEKRYDYVHKLAQGFGARFVLFWQPFLWVETGPVPPAIRAKEEVDLGKFAALRHNFELIDQAMAARLQDKPYFVDFRNVLCGRKKPVYQEDGIHLQDGGREIVAGQMARFLKAPPQPVATAGGPAQ